MAALLTKFLRLLRGKPVIHTVYIELPCQRCLMQDELQDCFESECD